MFTVIVIYFAPTTSEDVSSYSSGFSSPVKARALICLLNFNDETRGDTYTGFARPEKEARSRKCSPAVSLSNTFSNGCIHTRDVLVNQT